MSTTDFLELQRHLTSEPHAPTLGRHMGPGYILPQTTALLAAVRLTATEEIRNLGLAERLNPIAPLIPSGIYDPTFVKIKHGIELAGAANAFASPSRAFAIFDAGIRVRIANHRDGDETAVSDIPIGTIGYIVDQANDDEQAGFQPAWNVQFEDGFGLYWVPEFNLEIAQ